MLNRTERIKDMVLQILTDFPTTRGDDTQLYIRVLQKYYWKVVQVRTKPSLTLNFGKFENLLMVPAPESVRRRRQEIHSELRHRIERGEITGSMLLPTERVIHKRIRSENAHRHVFGNGQLAISDYLGDLNV
jgi:hypothetical protein